jgi:hypothetical protein
LSKYAHVSSPECNIKPKYIRIADKFFANVAKFEYFGTTVTNQSDIREGSEITTNQRSINNSLGNLSLTVTCNTLRIKVT